MDSTLQATAQACLTGAENGTMSFPEIVGALINAGFDGYLVDFRLAQARRTELTRCKMRRSGDYVDSGEGWARPAGRGKAFVWLIRLAPTRGELIFARR